MLNVNKGQSSILLCEEFVCGAFSVLAFSLHASHSTLFTSVFLKALGKSHFSPWCLHLPLHLHFVDPHQSCTNALTPFELLHIGNTDLDVCFLGRGFNVIESQKGVHNNLLCISVLHIYIFVYSRKFLWACFNKLYTQSNTFCLLFSAEGLIRFDCDVL